MHPLEREIIRRIANNGGLPEPYEFGPWRPRGQGEKVNPGHIESISGVQCIPVRIYGSNPQEIPSNQKVLPMPSPIPLKHTGNNHLPPT